MILKKKLILKAITKNDCKDLWLWRNNPKTRKASFNTRSIPYQMHESWFHTKLNDPIIKIYIAYQGVTKVGVIRFEPDKGIIRVSVALNPRFFNKGYGSMIIKLGTKKMISDTEAIKPMRAEIKKDNIASIKAFSKAGYVLNEEISGKLIYEFKRKKMA